MKSVLRNARTLLIEHWTSQDVPALNRAGERVLAQDPAAVKWSVWGAVQVGAENKDWLEAMGVLRGGTGSETLPRFNTRATYEQVFVLFDRIIGDPVESFDREKVLDKITKLLALATSSNKHEAALAAYRARELKVRYRIYDFYDDFSG